MNQVITLTTDFGTVDGYVGAMKGALLSLCPGVTLVDISHAIPPQQVAQAAWTIRRAAARFPAGTIHIVVVDPGVGSARRALLASAGGHWYLAPDNGVLAHVIRDHPDARVMELRRATRWWQAHATFDGLALFAPAAGCVANGIAIGELASPIPADGIALPALPEPVTTPGVTIGEILLFDHFGNAISNIPAESLSGRSVRAIRCGATRFRLVTHYAADTAAPLALINSDHYLELALFGASAREQLHLTIGDSVEIEYED